MTETSKLTKDRQAAQWAFEASFAGAYPTGIDFRKVSWDGDYLSEDMQKAWEAWLIGWDAGLRGDPL